MPLAVIVAAPTAGPLVHPPCATAPHIDGLLAVDEWRLSRAAILPERWRLLLSASSKELHLGVKLPPRTYRYIDVYIRDGTGRLINLHASMQQGQRLLTTGWSDAEPAYQWQPSGWASSIAKRTNAAADAPIDQQLEPLDGYELTIPVTMLGRPPYRLRLEVRDFTGEGPDWVYPARSNRSDWQGWASLRALPRC